MQRSGMLLCTAAVALLSACGTRLGDPADPHPRGFVEGPVARTGAPWVVMGSQMLQAGTVLDGLSSRIPNMQVRRAQQECPVIAMRGRNALQRQPKPQVYVDGQRAADTCILAMIRAGDVNRVELYPGGHTTRPGYVSDSDGLILVFTRTAVDES